MKYKKIEGTYIIGTFNRGDEVNIDIYRLEDGRLITRDRCKEIEPTGIFYFYFKLNIESIKQEFVWVMSNGHTEQKGKVVLGSNVDDAEYITGAVWNEPARDHVLSGTMGNLLSFIHEVDAGRWVRDGHQMIFYKSDNVTELARFDLYKDDGITYAEEEDNVFERKRI